MEQTIKQLTDYQIQMGIRDCNRLVISGDKSIDHLDEVRVAYAWMNAQNIIGTINAECPRVMIENWGGRLVSRFAIAVAIHLHPGLKLDELRYKTNISKQFKEPHKIRLQGIATATDKLIRPIFSQERQYQSLEVNYFEEH